MTCIDDTDGLGVQNVSKAGCFSTYTTVPFARLHEVKELVDWINGNSNNTAGPTADFPHIDILQ